jgi:16S rRNA (adenine1518-N6/adenine1519-N6)-dimethyltransferase
MPDIPDAETPPTSTLDLTDIGTLRALLRRHGVFQTNKGLGQHLLISRKALEAVVAAAELGPDDNVLEVGAGSGVLTVELARRSRRVVAVEMDRAILPALQEVTAIYPNVEIIPRDLLTVHAEDVFGSQPYKFVANLPYYITALILRHILEAAARPERLVVMVQREVAERMTAAPGDMSLLSVSAQFYGTPAIVAHVPATAYYPKPKVDSAVVRLDLAPHPPLAGVARELFFTLARAGFAEKRKQIHNTLQRNLRVTPEQISAWLATSGIDPERRAQSLSLAEWLRLTAAALADPPRPFPEETHRERRERKRASAERPDNASAERPDNAYDARAVQ